jgi:hypothetical protein
LELLANNLRCQCGATVGPRAVTRGPKGASWGPTYHYPYKAPPAPPRKRDQGGKRV